MGFSGLCSGITLSPCKSSRNQTKIDSVAIHTMAGNMSAENCGARFSDFSVQASSNYGVDSQGIIWGYVDEEERSWCTSSGGVDRRSITIEVASTTVSEPYECTSAAYQSLINLLVDVCSRYNMYLRWEDNESYGIAASKGGPVDRQNMFLHRWFNRQKSCPGKYLYGLHSQIANDVNFQLRSGRNLGRSTYSGPGAFDSRIVIFIGDRRTLAMKQQVGKNNNVWSCAASMTLDWMKLQGVPQIENQITYNSAICFMLGTSEVVHKDPTEYASFINDKAQQWILKGAMTYVCSVNPVEYSMNDRLNNSMIQTWNQRLRNNLSSNVEYLDVYSNIFNSFKTTDGIMYDDITNAAIYQLVTQSIQQDQVSMYSNSAMIGGSPIQIDYTKINPYIITIDRTTSDDLEYDKMHDSGVVGVIIEAGYLYNLDHTKVLTFQQPKLEQQIQKISENSLEWGFYFISRAQNIPEAQSEMQEMVWIIRHHPCKLGIWVNSNLSNSININDEILDYFKEQFIKLGYINRFGLYITKDSLKNISWDKHQTSWLLWTIDHVESTSELQKLLTPEFFDV